MQDDLNNLLTSYENDFQIFQSIAEKEIQHVTQHQAFFNDGRPDEEDDGWLEIGFLDGSIITLLQAPDPDVEYVRVIDGTKKHESSFIRPIHLTETEALGNLEGCYVTQAHAVIDHYIDKRFFSNKDHSYSYVSGWIVFFSNGYFLSFINLGDACRILFNAIPDSAHHLQTCYKKVM